MFASEARTLDSPIEELRPADISPARSLSEKSTAVGAFLLLAMIDAAMKLSGFHRFYRMLRAWPTLGRPPENPEIITKTCTAVDRAATYYFKRAWCLQRSATAVCLLRLRGADARLAIGVQKVPFYAHAWAEVDGRVVNDHPQVQKTYTVLERC